MEAQVRSRGVFSSVKVFVACHSALQLSQLLVSGYMKSSISTIERRYGLSSQKSGLLAAFNEVGNTLLIVFVSFLGSRVHRPRMIGLGALLAGLASLLMALPHFLGGPYRAGGGQSYRNGLTRNSSELCHVESLLAATPSSNRSCVEQEGSAHEGIYALLLFAQLLLGVASAPLQPFGISYIDDHASKKNSPLYLGILLAVTAVGPAFGFLGGAFLLRFYVDFDKMSAADVELDRSDLRWVGAWWLGFLVASCLLFVVALPYFFFPRNMRPEDESEAEEKRQPDVFQELGLLHFLKSFPSMLCRTLRSPVYLLVVLAQVNLAAMVAGLATFMAKFIEKQFSQPAAFSNVMIGGVSIPLAVLGTMLGGVMMRRWTLGVGAASKICAVAILLSLCCGFPLIFMGCPTQKVDGVFPPRSTATTGCSSTCQCVPESFHPVCGSDGVEFTSPCLAGCVAMETDSTNKVINFTECRCVGGASGWATPGTCGSGCGHLLLPFVGLMAATCFMASFSQTPSYVIILRTVSARDKSLAVGIQYMLFRVLAFMPCPVVYGSVIDSTCVRWDRKCGKQTSCLYYDLDHFRHRFLGVQGLFMCGGLLCFFFTALVLHRKRADLASPEESDQKIYELVNEHDKELQVKPGHT
ncbi:solute carrier organic anion transporter family member 2B1 isoform X2 [Syngnathus scovelli]|uniref:solute carrier organic anion transporter family member 2B1 isoform X2 n=2 Tax=Syngnathus scovelli TaxID=161590 RepID=UPI0021106BFA|nr:solute carrier organic anion transporter family member 2B1 [Syngnathus scovelli]XP_049598737.1 solute carrier organic anion transporter family member 2B1 [Syngnathus scovelli]XP_049598738.1 solute carrier organic anion transporter family member 2B1 [Syngnathus scovelli]